MELFQNPHRILTAATELSELVERDLDPAILWKEVDTLFARFIGHRLFTVLRYDSAAREVVRLYTNKPLEYPVRGAKKMNATPWGERVLKHGRPYIGKNSADIRWAFPDHELLSGMGLHSVLNLPIRENGSTVGTLNLLHRAGYYNEGHLPVAQLFSALLVPLFDPIFETGIIINRPFTLERKCNPNH